MIAFCAVCVKIESDAVLIFQLKMLNRIVGLHEWEAWREFDRLRFSWGLREQFPHSGFRGTVPHLRCSCARCNMVSDEKRCIAHNVRYKIRNKKKSYDEDYLDSDMRSEILTKYVDAIKEDRALWKTKLIGLLDELLQKGLQKEKSFLLELVRLTIELISDNTKRMESITMVQRRVQEGFVKSLRLYPTPLLARRHQQEWTKY